jgi:DNA-binding LacI/PurR family transcriptional regulator
MAARAAELLIATNGGEPGPDVVHMLPFELIVRGSTAAPGTLSTAGG